MFFLNLKFNNNNNNKKNKTTVAASFIALLSCGMYIYIREFSQNITTHSLPFEIYYLQWENFYMEKLSNKVINQLFDFNDLNLKKKCNFPNGTRTSVNGCHGIRADTQGGGLWGFY